MTIYTRAGDKGQTSLADGARVAKSSIRVEAYGTVDEANSAVGLARAAVSDELLDSVLHFVQQRLFNCSSRLATPEGHETEHTPSIAATDIDFLEASVDRFLATAGEVDHFVLETGCEAAARLQLARAITRRAERRAVALAADESVDALVIKFLNRLSDTLFAAARYVNATCGEGDEFWDPAAEPPSL